MLSMVATFDRPAEQGIVSVTTLILFLFVTCGVLLGVLWPLLRRPRTVAHQDSSECAVYREQLTELERAAAYGLLLSSEAETTRLEIQRRLLAADRAGRPAFAPVRRSPVLAAAIAMLLAGGSMLVYGKLGTPSLPDFPFVGQARAADAGADAHADARQAAKALRAKLAADPANADAWLLYARTAGSLRQWDEAIGAYRRLIALGHAGADVQAGLGEMLTMQAQGTVTPAAHDAFVAALKVDPKNDVALYYMAIAAGQAGLPARAIERFQQLLAAIPQDSPMRAEIARRISEAAKAAGLPMPALAQGTPASAADADNAALDTAASLPPAQRSEMISAMVTRLADRLQARPDDADGWMRLGRAYAVLGRRDESGAAYEKAAALRPTDTDLRLEAVEMLLSGLKPDDPLPAPAIALLRQVQALAPNEAAVLWYLGVEAARDGKAPIARDYWNRLLKQLSPDGDDAKMVRAALDQVKG